VTSFLLKGLFAPSHPSATRVPRGFYDFLTVDFQHGRKIRSGQKFPPLKTVGKIYLLSGNSCRVIGTNCLVFEAKKNGAGDGGAVLHSEIRYVSLT